MRIGGGETDSIHSTLLLVSRVLARLGLRVFIIGARSVMVHGVDWVGKHGTGT